MKKDKQETVEELNVVGPGVFLSEAREKQGLSIEYVAAKLNVRAVLIQNIEADIYDKTLPDTYNRGYLKNYAKLMGLPVERIINYYEQLNFFQEDNAEMRSFSRGTVKKAENNMLMWISYLILAVFIGFTMMWWLQEDKVNKAVEVIDQVNTVDEVPVIKDEPLSGVIESTVEQKMIEEEFTALPSTVEESIAKITVLTTDVVKSINKNTSAEVDVIEQMIDETVFTFSGDCWVNIYDATGKRIAWGIKKSGYIMSINGTAPFNITLGKPELVAIKFNGADVDMSSFRAGHISKFTLPLTPS